MRSRCGCEPWGSASKPTGRSIGFAESLASQLPRHVACFSSYPPGGRDGGSEVGDG
jgi:hypothetical protein